MCGFEESVETARWRGGVLGRVRSELDSRIEDVRSILRGFMGSG
jgi:hypothetical protein